MTSNRNSVCPRCGAEFHCGAAEPGPCACGAIKLDPELRRALSQRYSGCLCGHCLAAVASGAIDPDSAES